MLAKKVDFKKLQDYLVRFYSSSSDIPYKNLRNGTSIPSLGFGTLKIKRDVAKETIKCALRSGYRHFDCAYEFQNEKEIGEGINEGLKELGISRSDIWVTGKLWNTFHSPEHVKIGCEKSLNNLGLDYLDLYLMHWPVAQIPPGTPNIGGEPEVEDTPIWETYEAMLELQKLGLTKTVGVSNFTISELKNLIKDTGITPDVHQFEIHPYLYQEDLVEFCKQNGIVIIAHSSLATGVKPNDSFLPPLLDHPLIVSMAQKYNRTPAQISLRWGLQNNFVVIAKSVNTERIQQNFNIMDFSLDLEDMEKMNKLAIECNYRFVSPSFRAWNDSDSV